VQSDRIGRKRLCLASAVLAAVWAFPLFWLIDTGQPLLARTGSSAAISAYVLVIALVCLASLVPLRETKDADFTDGLQKARRS
jgi:hypothetical protein